MNPIAVVYAFARLRHYLRRNAYSRFRFVGLIAAFGYAAAPVIYGVKERAACAGVVGVTAAATGCDIADALAIECRITFVAGTAHEILCQGILPLMGLVNLVGKLRKISGAIIVPTGAEAAVLMYGRFIGVDGKLAECRGSARGAGAGGGRSLTPWVGSTLPAQSLAALWLFRANCSWQ